MTWTRTQGARETATKQRIVDKERTGPNLEHIPWSVAVEHEDLHFMTYSGVIEPSEDKKRDASLGKIVDIVKRGEKFMKMRLYVAGHTDTVGANAKNRKLSLDRAHSIAKYFRKKGLAIS